jgi:hypothetical protein
MVHHWGLSNFQGGFGRNAVQYEEDAMAAQHDAGAAAGALGQ